MSNFENIQFLYSETILAFVEKVRFLTKEILKNEIGVKVTKNRFLIEKFSYPLQIITFEDFEKRTTKLGYFDSEFYEIGINKVLIFTKDQNLLKNLLRHELAHYFTYIKYGNTVESHGKEFREICKRYNWDKEVYSASIEITEKDHSMSPEPSAILSKIQKLLALSSSPNVHESESATIKANELLLKYNLENISISEENGFSMKRILRYKRHSAKMSAICTILRTFFVFPVIGNGQEYSYLEISGKKTNVEIAEYVGYFLDNKLDLLWDNVRKNNPYLKGLTAKNSFFRGLANGYTDKITSLQKKSSKASTALVAIESALDFQTNMIYPHLKTTSRSFKHCASADKLGKKEGKNLSIHQAVSKKSADKTFYLT